MSRQAEQPTVSVNPPFYEASLSTELTILKGYGWRAAVIASKFLFR